MKHDVIVNGIWTQNPKNTRKLVKHRSVSVWVVFSLAGVINLAVLLYLLGRKQGWWGGLIPAEGPVIAGALVACAAALTYYSAERSRHHAAAELLHDQAKEARSSRVEAESNLRNRFLRSVEQLSSQDQFTVRLAGVHALAILANDWYEFDKHIGVLERQVCIDILCSYLRSDTVSNYDERQKADEITVRNTIVDVLSRNGARWRVGDKVAIINLDSAILTDLNLTGRDMTNVNLRNAQLSGAKLVRTNLRGANLTAAQLRGADLRYAVMSQATMMRAKLTGTLLAGANFHEAQLSKSDFSDAKCSGATFDGAILRGANLSGAVMRDASLTGSDLKRANLSNADFEGAFLTNACLSGANADCASFRSTQMVGVDLQGASLRGTGFSLSRMERANLTGAVFGVGRTGRGKDRRTSLRGAYLASSIGLTATQVSMAVSDQRTVFPNAAMPPGKILGQYVGYSPNRLSDVGKQL